jgi:uncharacterized protein (DUF1330 family)
MSLWERHLRETCYVGEVGLDAGPRFHKSLETLAPARPISGAEAFDRYIEHTLPILRKTGGDILFLGQGGPFLIGPGHERWDMAMLIRQASAASSLSFASHAEYLAGLGHRTAAVTDSRLLPLSEMPLPGAGVRP